MSPTVRVHAPGHPVGSQLGPNGWWSNFCKRDDCDWRETTGPGYPKTQTYSVEDPAVQS